MLSEVLKPSLTTVVPSSMLVDYSKTLVLWMLSFLTTSLDTGTDQTILTMSQTSVDLKFI
jgi:hypothetical protein